MSYGLSRDFSAAFNSATYSPFASKAPTSDENTVERQQRTAAKNLAHRKGIPFAEALAIVAAPTFVADAVKRKATRVNPEANWCQTSGMSLQKAEIRHELAKTKATTRANG